MLHKHGDAGRIIYYSSVTYSKNKTFTYFLLSTSSPIFSPTVNQTLTPKAYNAVHLPQQTRHRNIQQPNTGQTKSYTWRTFDSNPALQVNAVPQFN